MTLRKLDCQQELEDFTEESRQLETELEATIEQNEKSLRDLRSALNQQQLENDSIRVCFFILNFLCNNLKQKICNF